MRVASKGEGERLHLVQHTLSQPLPRCCFPLPHLKKKTRKKQRKIEKDKTKRGKRKENVGPVRSERGHCHQIERVRYRCPV